MAAVGAAGRRILLCGVMVPASVHEGAYRRSNAYRYPVSAHSFAVLLCDLGEAGCGRCSAGIEHDGKIHDRNFHGSDSSRSAGAASVPDRSRFDRHLVRMADRMVHRDCAFPALLQERTVA